MKEFKGTKGEWSVRREYGCEIDITNRDGDICRLGLSEFIDETKLANAKLIAAAPELLKALVFLKQEYEQLVDCGDCGDWNPRQDNCIVLAKEAINKALN